eukprot:m.90271 g.90271  ORF g.90271 m.90271 type:complete len:1366 (-) comp26381_c0_seq1:90-4187(-)
MAEFPRSGQPSRRSTESAIGRKSMTEEGFGFRDDGVDDLASSTRGKTKKAARPTKRESKGRVSLGGVNGKPSKMKIQTTSGLSSRTTKPYAAYEQILEKEGVAVVFYEPKKQPQDGTMMVEMKKMQLVISGQRLKTIRIDLIDIQEVRYGDEALDCKNFRECDTQHADSERAVVIFHGHNFRQQQLCLCVSDPLMLPSVIEGVTALTHESAPERYTSDQLLPAFKNREVGSLTGSFGMKHFKYLCKRLHIKLSARECKDYLEKVTELAAGSGNEEHFAIMYDLLMHNDLTLPLQQMKEIKTHSKSAGIKSPLADIKEGWSQSKLKSFLTKNKNPMSASDVLKRYSANQKELTAREFIHFLHSSDNDVRQPSLSSTQVTMDMNQPLVHYFIASSHNTYLMGDQYKSESSPEAYIAQLRRGVRSVEIDCWNGPNDTPIVYHGYTLTKKIKFADVLPAIRNHAFWRSPYPLILSIENHCSVAQQEVMATLFKDWFGDSLITGPVEPNETCYPSPNSLKGRIIVKHKKLNAGADEVEKNAQSDDADISSAYKNGYLDVRHPVDGTWQKHYFVLNSEFLSFIPEDDEDDAEEGGGDEFVSEVDEDVDLGELQEWFHGKVPGGRETAGKIVRTYVNNKHVPAGEPIDGTFLVRSSDSAEGYTISFWKTAARPIQNVKINKGKDGRLGVNNTVTFKSLFELIEYYRRSPLVSPTYEIILRTGVPVSSDHESAPWYFADISRKDAEERFAGLPDESFLVRKSESSAGIAFAITFRAGGKTKHCLVIKEGRMFTIPNEQFDSMSKMIKQYQTKPLYKKTKLKFVANDEFVESQKDRIDTYMAQESIYASADLYATPNSLSTAMAGAPPKKVQVTCRALYPYTASGPRQDFELTFPKGAIITNVETRDNTFWSGQYNGKIGQFPDNFVELIDEAQRAKEEASDQEQVLGSKQKSIEILNLVMKADTTVEGRAIFRFENKFDASQTVVASSMYPLEVAEWSEKISEAAKQLTQAKRKGTTRERDMGKGKAKTKFKIAKSLSDIVHYSQSVPFSSFEQSTADRYTCMSSFKEPIAFKVTSSQSDTDGICQAVKMNNYNKRQLSRVYPAGKRIDSSNFNPQQLWNAGIQLVALNLQTPDKGTWLHNGLFQQNGGCGLVLKPKMMIEKQFNPYQPDSNQILEIKLCILSGYHLPGTSGSLSPFVQVDISGVEVDNTQYRTKSADSNGLFPLWAEEAQFEVHVPELASLGFIVNTVDNFGDAIPIAQHYLALGRCTSKEPSPYLKNGWHSVPLFNTFGSRLGLASLLVHFNISVKKAGSSGSQKAEVSMLQHQRDSLIREMQVERSRHFGSLEDAPMKRLDLLEQRLQSVKRRLNELGAG